MADCLEEDYEESYEEESLSEDQIYTGKASASLMNLKSHAPKKKGMYFNEEYVCGLIKEYQKNEFDENNAPLTRNKELEEELTANLLLIINAIINKYSMWKFDAFEDLQIEALKECWRYLPNFDTSKGTCFNLFSIIAKYHLIGYTKKDKNNRKTADIDIHPEVESNHELNYELFFDDMELLFLKKIQENYGNDPETAKKYTDLTAILMEYLHKNQQVIGKNDLLGAFRAYGYKTSDFKKFIVEMSKWKEEFYELAKK